MLLVIIKIGFVASFSSTYLNYSFSFLEFQASNITLMDSNQEPALLGETSWKELPSFYSNAGN